MKMLCVKKRTDLSYLDRYHNNPDPFAYIDVFFNEGPKTTEFSSWIIRKILQNTDSKQFETSQGHKKQDSNIRKISPFPSDGQ